jgi:hypothetical protein
MSEENAYQRPPRTPRWAPRLKAMAYGDFGATRFNELTHAKKIIAKKDGAKVIVDLNSIDDYYAGLPAVGDEVTDEVAA